MEEVPSCYESDLTNVVHPDERDPEVLRAALTKYNALAQ